MSISLHALRDLVMVHSDYLVSVHDQFCSTRLSSNSAAWFPMKHRDSLDGGEVKSEKEGMRRSLMMHRCCPLLLTQ